MNRSKLLNFREFFSFSKSILSSQKSSDLLQRGDSGQTLVEFMLLLAVIASLSMIFLKFMNNNISNYWTWFVQKIVDDPSQKIKI